MAGNWPTGRSVVSQPSLHSPGSRELAAPRSPHASGPALRPPGHHPLHDLTTRHTGPTPGAADPGQGRLSGDRSRTLSVSCLSTKCWGWSCVWPCVALKASHTFLFLIGLNMIIALTLGSQLCPWSWKKIRTGQGPHPFFFPCS